MQLRDTKAGRFLILAHPDCPDAIWAFQEECGKLCNRMGCTHCICSIARKYKVTIPTWEEIEEAYRVAVETDAPLKYFCPKHFSSHKQDQECRSYQCSNCIKELFTLIEQPVISTKYVCVQLKYYFKA